VAIMTTTTSSGQAHRRITAHKRFNRFVGAILRSPLHWVFSRRLLLLEVRGRRTGRVHAFPVGYLQEADTLYVLVAEYRTKTWWRNFQDGAPAKLRLRGRTVQGTGKVLRWESDADTLTAALDRYLAALPFVRRPLGLTGGPDAPDSEALRKAAREVVMVRISLVGETGKDATS
jgi:F420H(2)-dependent quinone reductase